MASDTDTGKNAGDAGDCNGGVGSAVDNVVTCPGTTMKADPINTATGNKYQQDTDFHGSSWLTFRRFYNSLPTTLLATLGPQWRHSFDRSLSIKLAVAGSENPSTIRLYRPDGSSEQFQKNNGLWTADADVADTLTEQDDTSGNPTGYAVFIAPLRQTEQYSTAGLLQSITDASGQAVILTYSTANTPSSIAPAANLLLTVTDPTGRQLGFTYNTNRTIATVTQPDGGTLTYSYDPSTRNLTSVQYPDGKTLQYAYNESSLNSGTSQPSVLTGVIDEANARYASTGYSSTGQAVSSTFALGANATTFSYNSNGSTTLTLALGNSYTLTPQSDGFGTLKVTSVSAACGTQCGQPWQTQTYDANGYPSSRTDFNNNVTATTYNSAGLLTQQIEAQGTSNQRTTTTTWNTALRVPLTQTVLNASGTTIASTAWVYNTAGQTLARCDIDPTVSAAASYTCATTGTVPAGVRRTTYAYCTAVDTTQCPLAGLLLTATGPRTDLTQTTTYTYYLTDSNTSKHGDLQSVTDALGHTTTYLSYDGAGRVLSQQDANGVVTTFTYYPRGWLKTRSVGGSTTTITYTAYGAVQTITDPDNVTVTYGYDTAHRLTTITDAQGNYVQYTLDASGNRTAENTYTAGSSTASHTLMRQFNALGQLTEIIDGLNHTVFNASANGNYDANGNLLQSVDALNTQRKLGYDALNRLTSTVDDYNGTDTLAPNTTTSKTYDSLDRLTQVTDPNSLNTIYGYDGLSNNTSLQSPDTGTSTDTYDAAGNRLVHTDAKGVVSTTSYDALNRPISTTFANATLNITYAYDDANSVTGCTSSAPIGRLTRIVENAVTTVYCYDPRGNVLQKRQITGSTADTTSYAYTAGDRLSQLTAPDGTVISDSYNALGQLSGVQVTPVGGSASAAVSGITYLPFGPISGYTLGNGQMVIRTYDATYALTDITSPALNLHFARDALGRITAEGNTPGASLASETYRYDPLSRLVEVDDANGNALQSYTYNPTGDRLSKTGNGLATGSYSYTTGTHQLSGIGNGARTRDANGNMTGNSSAGQTWGYGYNGRNRLTVVQANGNTVGTYGYNALGQRISKVATLPTAVSQRFAYDEQGNLIGEYGTTNRDYVWMGGIPVAIIDTVGSTSMVNYVTADALGTPRAVSDSTGTTLWSWAWLNNPFGEQAPTSTNGYTLNLRFPGQYFDAETGLMYNGHRYYDPTMGRFPQPDPVGFNGGIGLYVYGLNNPMIYIDPTGLSPPGAPPPIGPFTPIDQWGSDFTRVGPPVPSSMTIINSWDDISGFKNPGTNIVVYQLMDQCHSPIRNPGYKWQEHMDRHAKYSDEQGWENMTSGTIVDTHEPPDNPPLNGTITTNQTFSIQDANGNIYNLSTVARTTATFANGQATTITTIVKP
ncbi:RHS repeat-associated protein [Rhodanobacter sp. ANJX3]|nr:RHS repeat-associated protein [Rhodanobacter sp. ANJX3]